MNPEVDNCLKSTRGQMEKALSHLESELSKIRAGKAHPAMLDGVMVEYYGSMVPLSQVANVNSQDARTIVIQPWEKSTLEYIERAIHGANLGLNPQNDGVLIRINVPPLTEERRKDLVKKAKGEAENCKVTLRTLRRESNELVKKMKSSGLPEDEAKDTENKIQLITDEFSTKCDKHIEAKEKEIMTV